MFRTFTVAWSILIRLVFHITERFVVTLASKSVIELTGSSLCFLATGMPIHATSIDHEERPLQSLAAAPVAPPGRSVM